MNIILKEIFDSHYQNNIYAIEDDEGIFGSAGSIQTDFQSLCGVGQSVASIICSTSSLNKSNHLIYIAMLDPFFY